MIAAIGEESFPRGRGRQSAATKTNLAGERIDYMRNKGLAVGVDETCTIHPSSQLDRLTSNNHMTDQRPMLLAVVPVRSRMSLISSY